MVARQYENLTKTIITQLKRKHKNTLNATLQRSNKFLKSPFQQGTWQLASQQSLAIIYNLHIRSLK